MAVVGGCSGGSDDSDEGAGPQASTAPQPRTSSEDDPATDAEVASVDVGKVIASQTFTLRRNPEDTVEVGIASLEVSGQVATLRLVFTPRFKSVAADAVVSVYDIYENSFFGPYLLDLENLKRYDVVRGTSNQAFSSDSTSTQTVNGTPMAAYVVYAAPQDGATAVDVHIADWWPAFKAVPVQR